MLVALDRRGEASLPLLRLAATRRLLRCFDGFTAALPLQGCRHGSSEEHGAPLLVEDQMYH